MEKDSGRQGRTAVQGAGQWIGVPPWLWQWLRARFAVFNIWLWAFVFLPTLVAGVYYFGIAADLYMSEARFIVRSQSHSAPSALGSLLQDTGIARATDDTFSVHDFIMSRDAVRKLELNNQLEAIFERTEADFLTRFPDLIWGSSFEALYKHYADFVGVDFDSTTGLTTLRVKAYRPEDAKAVVSALLMYSEELVNELNKRAENDALETARREVSDAEASLVAAQDQFAAYRLRAQILDPKLTSTGLFNMLQQITSARISTETQLSELIKETPGSPQIPALRTRLATLDRQIAEESAKVTGDKDSVVAKLAEYEHLAFEQQLREKALAAATTSLEQARLDARRQHLYIERVVEPNLADYPLYPRRIFSFAVVMASCLITYGVAWMLIAGVREHAAA